jgi:hypothetical protein
MKRSPIETKSHHPAIERDAIALLPAWKAGASEISRRLDRSPYACTPAASGTYLLWDSG